MLLTIRQAADFLQITPKLVRSLIARGDLRHVRIGKHWRVDQDDLDLFVARRKV